MSVHEELASPLRCPEGGDVHPLLYLPVWLHVHSSAVFQAQQVSNIISPEWIVLSTIYLSVYLSFYPSFHLSMYLSIHYGSTMREQSIHLSAYRFWKQLGENHLSVHLSILGVIEIRQFKRLDVSLNYLPVSTKHKDDIFISLQCDMPHLSMQYKWHPYHAEGGGGIPHLWREGEWP